MIQCLLWVDAEELESFDPTARQTGIRPKASAIPPRTSKPETTATLIMNVLDILCYLLPIEYKIYVLFYQIKIKITSSEEKQCRIYSFKISD